MSVKKITHLSGTGVAIKGNDIDTDRIIPARFLKEITFERMGQYAFYDERFDQQGMKKEHPFNDEKYKGSSILIVNKNFGCGSSREHAPQALMRFGIKAIIGESFAEIFAGNCTMLGIPLLVGNEKEISKLMDFVESKSNKEISINVEEKTISYVNKSIQLDMNPSSQKALIEGTWDSVALMLSNDNKINIVEKLLPYLNNYEV